VNVQILKTDGGDLVVLTRRDFDVLRARAGDPEAEAVIAARLLRDAAGETAVPAAVADALLDGEPPVKVLMAYRGLTQQKLAALSGLSQPFISKLVRGDVGMRKDSRDALARALEVSADLLGG